MKRIKKLQLVDDAKDYKHWWSAKLSLLSVVSTTTWALMPDGAKDWLPAEIRPYIAIAMYALISLATLFKQNIKRNDKQD